MGQGNGGNTIHKHKDHGFAETAVVAILAGMTAAVMGTVMFDAVSKAEKPTYSFATLVALVTICGAFAEKYAVKPLRSHISSVGIEALAVAGTRTMSTVPGYVASVLMDAKQEPLSFLVGLGGFMAFLGSVNATKFLAEKIFTKEHEKDHALIIELLSLMGGLLIKGSVTDAMADDVAVLVGFVGALLTNVLMERMLSPKVGPALEFISDQAKAGATATVEAARQVGTAIATKATQALVVFNTAVQSLSNRTQTEESTDGKGVALLPKTGLPREPGFYGKLPV